MPEYKITYKIDNDPPRITCLVCGMTSYNNNDIAYLFCGNCKEYHNILKVKDAELLNPFEGKSTLLWPKGIYTDPDNMPDIAPDAVRWFPNIKE